MMQLEYKLCSLEKLLADLEWDSLQERRTKHKFVIFYRSLITFHRFVPPLVQDCSPYKLRNSNDVATIYTYTKIVSEYDQEMPQL